MQTDSAEKPFALVIEDDPDADFIISEALREAGFRTETTDDGNRAMSLLQELRPALITLDMHLPKISGSEILRQIRADPEMSAVEVMLITVDYRMAESVRQQANWVMIKPVTYNQIRDLAQRLATRHRPDS